MKKKIKNKALIIKTINKNIIESTSIMVVNYKYINSINMNVLYTTAKKKDVKLYVVRNRLLIKPIKGTKYEGLKDYVQGQIMLCFSKKNINDSLVLWKKLKLKEEKIKTLFYEGNLIKTDKRIILGKINISDTKKILLKTMIMLKINTIGRLIYILMLLIEKRELEK